MFEGNVNQLDRVVFVPKGKYFYSIIVSSTSLLCYDNDGFQWTCLLARWVASNGLTMVAM